MNLIMHARFLKNLAVVRQGRITILRLSAHYTYWSRFVHDICRNRTGPSFFQFLPLLAVI